MGVLDVAMGNGIDVCAIQLKLGVVGVKRFNRQGGDPGHSGQVRSAFAFGQQGFVFDIAGNQRIGRQFAIEVPDSRVVKLPAGNSVWNFMA